MKTPRATHTAIITGILLLSIQSALCLPPGLPAPLSAVSTEGIATRDRAERLHEEGRLPEAERLLSDFLALHGGIAPTPLLAHIHNDLGFLWQEQHRLTDAHRAYKKAVEAWDQCGPNYRLHAAVSLSNLATVLWDDGRLSDAHKALVRSAAIQLEVAGPFSPALVPLYYNQGVLAMALARFADAEESYRKFLRIAGPEVDASYRIRAALVNSDLALLCRQQGRNAEATGHFEQSRQIWSQWYANATGLTGPQSVDSVLLLNLAASFWKAGAASEAAGVAALTISTLEPATGLGRARLVRALQLNARILRESKRKSEARESELRARRILQSGKSGLPTENGRIDLAALQTAGTARHERRR